MLANGTVCQRCGQAAGGSTQKPASVASKAVPIKVRSVGCGMSAAAQQGWLGSAAGLARQPWLSRCSMPQQPQQAQHASHHSRSARASPWARGYSTRGRSRWARGSQLFHSASQPSHLRRGHGRHGKEMQSSLRSTDPTPTDNRPAAHKPHGAHLIGYQSPPAVQHEQPTPQVQCMEHVCSTTKYHSLDQVFLAAAASGRPHRQDALHIVRLLLHCSV